ncbi:zinc finger protein ZFP2-like isoform X2 [Leptopilina boulardi]|uniref:zinc finger protein ZFP2-like isoform X2 n=1 Tax=Leptopilina boulardi TaxID=63433 RepID=UPI0021F64F5E|nr:zinc finger protein ZFP2-like isoform X2 [Leptopilina boulardi]
MGSMSLVCPMCCGETFTSSQSLKYHLLSMTDNLYCPGCSERSDSVLALIEHLDYCGQPDGEAKLNSKRKTQKDANKCQLLMKELQSSEEKKDKEVKNDDNKSQKEVISAKKEEKDKTKKVPKIQSTSQVKLKKIEKVFVKIENKYLKKNQDQQDPLMELSIPIDDVDEKLMEKHVIAILPDGSEIFNDDEDTVITMDNIQEIDESKLMKVKEELNEESDSLYNCSSCSMSFNSVLDHIKEFHDGQEVVLEMADQQYEELTTPIIPIETEEPIATAKTRRSRQTMNTLRTEECIDSEGRLYTRKVVQIERFWDQSQQQQQILQQSQTTSAPKSSMIEKFFSNAEGVKVRDKVGTSSTSGTANRIYRCTECLEHFPKLSEFRTHTCSQGNKNCEICDLSFANLKALQLHMKVHEMEIDGNQSRTFICGICGTEFATHKSLRLHSRMHAPVRSRHVDAPEGTKDSTFTCFECGKTFSESYRAVHMALHSGDSATCPICNRKFDSMDSLTMHAAVHLDTNNSQSPPPIESTATTSSATESNANKNSTSIAESETIQIQKPYQCQHCGRRFTRPHEKVKHERIHTGEKPHACEVCGKTFRVSYCLTLHMRTHTGVRPYACQHCGKRFKASSVYNHHLLTHGDVRAYNCPFCPKTFKTRVQLAGHKNSHTKPFHCTECSRPFASLYAVRAHIETHKKDNNLKFSCYICGASYGRAFALKDHLKQHGGSEIQQTPEPAREEEVQEVEEFILADEDDEEEETEIDNEELVVPSPLPIRQNSAESD